MEKPFVIGLGALNIDRIFSVKKLLADGEASIQSKGTYPGGSAANTVYGLARLGVATGFFGAVGDDDTGRLLLSDLSAVGTDTRYIVIKANKETGSVFCMSNEIDRSLYVLPGANSELYLKDLDLLYLKRASWLHMSSFVDDAQFELSQEIVSSAKNALNVSFSPGALYVNRGLKALKPILKHTDILFMNSREIEDLTGTSFESGAGICMKAGCRIVAVTLGKGITRGGNRLAAYIKDRGSENWISGGNMATANIADTTGAGDAFAAGFLFGTITNQSILTCGEYGHTAALSSLKSCGAREGLPTRIQLLREHGRLYLK